MIVGAPILGLVLAAAPQISSVHARDLAPEPVVKEWVGADGEVGLSAYAGDTVLLYTFALHADGEEDARATGALLELMRDAAEANEDLGARALGLVRATGEQREDVERVRDGLALGHPIGLVESDEDPYAGAGADDRVWVIGPNGDVIWTGNALANLAEFSVNVQEALRREAVPRLSRTIGGRLLDAARLYALGRLAAAEKEARGLATGELEEDATYLADAAATALADWVERAEKAATSGALLEYARLARAIERGAGKGPEGKALRKLERKVAKDEARAAELLAANAWLDSLTARPALFPVRRTDAADRYLEKLDAILELAPVGGEVHARVTALRARYR